VQSTEFRRQMGAVCGYQARQTGTIAYEPPKSHLRADSAATDRSPRGRPS
jgi:hypothetical protein